MSQLPVGAVPDDDEEALVVAAVGGDHAAFAALYDRHYDRVYRHCYFRLGERHEAEDITQQTFLQAWRAIGRYRQTGAPIIAWLLTISQRLIINLRRRPAPVLGEDLPEPVAGADSDPEARLLVGIAADQVRAAILQLKPDRQQVIVLRFLEDLSVSEVAATLGKTDNNVRVIQHRGLAELKRILGAPPVTQRAPEPVLKTFRRTVSAVARRLGRAPDE